MGSDDETEKMNGGSDEEADVAAMLDLSKKKKKKKKTTKKEGATTTATASPDAGDITEQQRLLAEQDAAQELTGEGEECHEDDQDRKAEYTYDELLDRVVDLLQANNPDLVEKKRTRIKPPQLQLMSSKKTLWQNFQEICSMMQRDPQHVYQFFMAELGTEGSIDGNQRLIIRGKYVAKYIESLLRKYVVEYVTCEMCRSPNTDLVKDQGSRLYFCNCRDCGSSRSVAPIKSGYHATSRADRRAARAGKN
jgi:translation initiation factor 2 subunit 2